eukprot:scaffold225675_cov31-Attheya_sp.AAC.1
MPASVLRMGGSGRSYAAYPIVWYCPLDGGGGRRPEWAIKVGMVGPVLDVAAIAILEVWAIL